MTKSLCGLNLTYFVISYKFNDLVSLDEKTNTIKGKLSGPLYYLLGNKKSCLLLDADKVGTGGQPINGSLHKALRLMADKVGDMIFLAEPYYFQADYVDFSYPVVSEAYVISHQIKNTSDKSNPDLIQELSLDFSYFLIYMLINLLAFFFLTLQVRSALIRRFRIRSYVKAFRAASRLVMKSVKNHFHSYKFLRIRSLGFIIFTLYVAYFFTGIFISNSFKTSKILVDTGDIIYNEKTLFLSKKYICWIKSEPSYFLATISPKDTFLEKVLRFKQKTDCVFEQNQISLETLSKFNTNGFMISAYFYAVVLISVLVSIEKVQYWISDNFYSLPLCYLYRKSLDKKTKDIINDITSSFLENGIQEHSYKLSIILIQNHDTLSTIFESLEKFKDQNTKFFPINFDSLKLVLYLLFLIQTSLGLVFIVDVFMIRNLRNWLMIRKYGY